MKANREELIQCLKKVVSGGTLYFDGRVVRSGNLSFQVETPLPGDLDLSCEVPGKPILDMLKSIREDEVEITSRRNKLMLSAGGLKVDFKVLQDVGKLTKLPLPDEPSCLDVVDFVEGLRVSSSCVSRDESDGPLCGVRLVGSSLFACDKFRIFRYRLEEDAFINGSVPLDFIRALRNVDVDEGKLYVGTRISFVAKDGTVITSSLLAGDYPDLSGMFPDSEPVSVLFVGESVLDVFAKHRKYQSGVDVGEQEFEFVLSGKQCTIVSESDLGMLQETLDTHTDLGSSEIGFFANPVLFDGVDKKCTSFEFYPEDGVVMFTYGKSEYLIRTREV